MSESMPVPHNPIIAPNPVQLTPAIIDDIMPPRYTALGAKLVLYRPNQLDPVVSHAAPYGCMAFLLPASEAAHVRGGHLEKNLPGMTVLEDVIDPKFPPSGTMADGSALGAELMLMIPGQLLPVVPKIDVPHGTMLCVFPPESAQNTRAIIHAALEQHRVAMQRAAQGAQRNGVGRRG